ncbi:hypothetical protein GGR69_002070 [Xanthomonas arboricola]|nr:hypothetical protein [Xanthomonas arboricola]NIK44035.1 hypothetical protein [Xanthomonas arboricola]
MATARGAWLASEVACRSTLTPAVSQVVCMRLTLTSDGLSARCVRLAMLLIWAFAAERLVCDLAAGPLPAHPRGTRRKYVRVGSYAASMPRKVPRGWAGKDLSRWSACMVQTMPDVGCSDRIASDQLPDSTRATSSFLHDYRFTLWCGGLADCGTVGRHGCRHRAYMDVLAACPAGGEDPARSQEPFRTQRRVFTPRRTHR